ncbi:MAG: hypothetical protein KDD01_11835 [Phaeodactylibacter sp.]|nr:hypothetical protein [Phaeodactylibacter sp.]
MTEKKGVASPVHPAKRYLANLLPILVSLGWFIIIVPDYLFHHPYYTQGISPFKYWGLLAVLSILLGALYFFFGGVRNQGVKSQTATVNGFKIYLLFLLITNIILAWYGISNGLFESNPMARLLYFTGFMVLLHAAVLYIAVLGYAIGAILLQPFAEYLSGSSYKLIAIALGLSGMGFALVILGLLNLLTPWVLWPLAILITAWRFRSISFFIKGLFLTPVSIGKLKPQGVLAAALLLVFAAVNGIGAVKAFPTGFDGAALYMNTTKLIAEYHALPKGGQAFNWPSVMSLGNLLFGSTAVSILLSHLAGIFCLAAVYHIARLYVSPGNALLATALFYTAPFITFHSYYDEKVDLGFLFISLSTLLLLLEYFLKKGKEHTLSERRFIIKTGRLTWPPDLLIWIYAGWLTGFAFGIKYTALFNGIALLSYLFYRRGGRYAFFGSLITALSFVFLLGVHRFANVELADTSPFLLAGMLFVPGMALLWWAFRQSPMSMLRTAGIGIAFALTSAFAFSPWAVKHFSENRSLAVSALIQGKSPQPKLFIKRKYRKKAQNPALPREQALLNSQGQAANTANAKTRREEVQRYMGFETGLPLYLSLPYDLTMNTNLPGFIYLDIGFLWLLLLPLLLLSAKPENRSKNGAVRFSLFGRAQAPEKQRSFFKKAQFFEHSLKNLLSLLLMLFLLLISILSVYVTKAAPVLPGALADAHPEGFRHSVGGGYEAWMDMLINLANSGQGIYSRLSHFGFVSSLAALLLLVAAALWLASEKLRMMPAVLKGLLAFVVAYLFLWLLLGNGIPWYAFPALAMLPVIAVYYFDRPEQFLGTANARFSRYFLGFSFGLYFLLNLSLHFSDPERGTGRHLIFKTPFIQYATQSLSWEETLAAFNPFYLEALKYLNRDPSEKIYRVGTYMQYHITQNDRRVLEDNQLGQFDEVVSKLSDQNYFIQVLRDNGFRYILYDLNSASLDKTPEQSLRKKNIAFLNLLLDPGEVKLVVTDRIVEDPGGGVVQLPGGAVPGKPGLSGKITFAGSFALFEIL